MVKLTFCRSISSKLIEKKKYGKSIIILKSINTELRIYFKDQNLT